MSAAKSSILVQPDGEQIKAIRKELGETEEKLRHYVKLFYDWLNCENHLPKDVDERLVQSYIRLCKYNFPRAKSKFEKFIISTGKYSDFYNHGRVNLAFFSPYKYHRMATTLPHLTPEGYRIFAMQIEDPDITHLNMETLLKFIYFIGNHTFHEDFNSGMVVIIDLRNVGLHFIRKFDMMVFKKGIEVCVNIMPTRIRSGHIINLPGYAEALFLCTSALLKEKIRKRIVLHKSVDGLLDYFDRGLLPKEFGGTLKSLNEIGDDWKEYWLGNQKWLKKTEGLKLMGPVPKEKLIGLDECSMGGSFRQLAID